MSATKSRQTEKNGEGPTNDHNVVVEVVQMTLDDKMHPTDQNNEKIEICCYFEDRVASDQYLGCAGIEAKIWWGLSHVSFLAATICYLVNAIYWLYFKYRYDKYKMKSTTTVVSNNVKFHNGEFNAENTTIPAIDVSHKSTYYKQKHQEYADSAKWWELAGATLYVINPIFELLAGTLRRFCDDTCYHQPTLIETFWSLPWLPVASILFLVAALLYMVNVVAPLLDKDRYNDTIYRVVDLSAAIVFVIDAFVYLLDRLSFKRKQRGAGNETIILCWGKNYRGCLHVDWGFHADMLHIFCAFFEVVDHFSYTVEKYFIVCVLWGIDAILYLLEWIIFYEVFICCKSKHTCTLLDVIKDPDNVKENAKPIKKQR